MFNAYSLIIVLFLLAGLGTTLWGAVIIARARKNLHWPMTEGEISAAEASSEADDLLPQIEFAYTVNGQVHQTLFNFPSGTAPSQELTRQYMQKYPVGTRVAVYYDLQDPRTATLEPGPASGDWLIIGFGAGSLLLGFLMLIFS